jgi:DNA primase
LGRSINAKTKQFLIWCGVDNDQVQRWSLESLQHKDFLDFAITKKSKNKIKFKQRELPAGIQLDINNPQHYPFIEYLEKRKIEYDSYPFLITPNETGRNSNRIIIPYTYKNKIVGHTSRYLDNRTPKYINDQDSGYVFGYDFQKPEWQVCIVVEGIFDALSINGCALTHNTIGTEQAELLAQLNKKIIVVPDRDKAGLEIIDRALELGYNVSLPLWDNDVKDVNDAVIKYGRLSTLLSILENATMSKIKIELRKKQIAKRI